MASGGAFRSTAALLVAGLTAGCPASPPELETAEAAGPDIASRLETTGGTFVGGDGIHTYLLGAGDQVRITVFDHPDLSGEFQLDTEGVFAMPLVGDILGLGETTSTLEGQIETALLEGGYLVAPRVSIEVLNYRPFYIIGEVVNPGSYAYVAGMAVSNAVTLAGGFTSEAASDAITITRGGANGDPVPAAAEAEILPGDIIEVPDRYIPAGD